ncbi:putative glucose-methanol-choline oxidoreductase [Exidia glandulosa HHB12029]|uniref:Putative glucose-methanol-choline oxidoreductase n=1 Tax=Exidia glandulosa HHB12029 TaxID=1314781 RepID=A0A165PJ34_EXIGL|nr:putative glucose-methanol-choline oxidoreductase [Exidia glandulosa HHB12029]
MRCDLVAVLALGSCVTLAAPSAWPYTLRARNIVDQIADSYDFVIVGGGLAGLVLGARLSEDANHTVLVLESGGTGDDVRDRIDTPGDTYYNTLTKSAIDWNFQTAPQPGVNNRQLVWPRGKVLGGSSAMNGMYMNRPAEIEIDAWKGLLDNMDNANNWSWDALYAAMKKSETFTPPTDDIAQQVAITFNPSSHGTNGSIHQSYPGYTFPQVAQWLQAAPNAGIATSSDTYGGQNWGAYIATSAIDPTTWKRSYSRSGYLDALPPRSNYDVLANAHVSRLVFDPSSPSGNLSATAVEYTRDGGGTFLQVKVKKEVILAGGTVGSPTVLMHSGVGPKDVLDAAGVAVLSELPGVGQHLQDHLSVPVVWTTNADTAGSVFAANGPESTDPKFLSYVNSATAYVNASRIFGDGVSTFQTGILQQMNNYLPPASSDPTVTAGYKAIYSATANSILTSPVGQIELLLALNSAGVMLITAALQHPFSHGRIYIASNNPMDYPVIDPNYLANPADYTLLREGLKLARQLGNAAPLNSALTGENNPGPSVQTDQEWEDWLRGGVGTEFHPSSTCAMLPLSLGGVVDANLRVYGLANVRVADASVPPISFSAHLMSSTYGIAERASELVRAFYNGVPATTTTTGPGTSPSGTGTGTSDTSGGTGAAESAWRRPSRWTILCVVGALLLL